MSTKILGATLALAVTLTGAAFAVTAGAGAERSKPQSQNSSKVHELRLDRCPYYPSPVVCRTASTAR
jgi:hypothetical protein